MADLSNVNIRQCVSKLRPGSEYHWRGDGDTGNQYDAIGQWRDPETTKPTEAEIAEVWGLLKLRPEVDAARETKYATDTAAGFTDGGKTYSLAAESLANWQKLATTLRAEVDAEITERDDKVPLFTVAGEVVEMKVSNALELLAKIGKTARELQTRDYQWQGMIAAATTVQQLEAIQAAIEST